MIYDEKFEIDAVLDAFDDALEPLRKKPLDTATFERTVTKARSAFYDLLTSTVYPGFGRADLLASFALIDGDAARINAIDQQFSAITPKLVQTVARNYLRPDGRTVLSINPTSESAALDDGNAKS